MIIPDFEICAWITLYVTLPFVAGAGLFLAVSGFVEWLMRRYL